MSFKQFAGLVAATPLVVASALVAAEPGAVEQVRLRTSTVPLREAQELNMVQEERGEVVELGTPSAQTLKTKHFRVSVTMNIEHQSNAILDPDHNRDDWVFLPAIEVGYNVELGKGFSLDISARADLARYLRHEESTYWGPSGTLQLEYRPRPDLPRLYVGGQAYRYDLIDPAEEITRAGAVIAGTDKTWVFNEGRSLFSAGYQFARYFASPRIEDRDAHTLFASFTQQVWGQLYFQASYAWQFTIFENQDRTDARHITSVGFLYAFNNDSILRLYASYQRNDSTNPYADYENFTTGLGAAMTFRF